ncbi:hypothetical protein C0Q70_10574 [Pomacea canaliculata]|uniref:Peptidyl-prolyl cis-trans isomerase n=1 Tax=Pomacea canaliculata TaxID=400727 RepID=A0A2T7P3J6_POMCA|nr:hypothetical protein C0Q70_10574 [Pomacea canaliculata]
MSVIIETSIGDLTIDLYTEERPRCSENFLKLCKLKYYNFSLFHSVQKNLVAQTGDPTATGRGGDSVYSKIYGEQARFFDMEQVPRIKHKKRGLLSMVNNGSGMHGSQFFITLGEDLDYLDGKHTVFGEVAEGFEVLDKLNDAYCDEHHRPYRDIRIYHTVILDDPFDDPRGLIFPDKSPEPTKEMLESDRIGADEEIDDTKGMTEQEIKEMVEEREAKANAQLLEMVGDIPEADVKPPDNVLFVCKLNPVTTAEDLEIIFSRFGSILSCEVIKDQKTGESLQYAFIEFEKPEDCENAYFKMDNVLIDDRRIHVDFSQSVAKVKHEFKGKEKKEMEEDRPKYVLKSQERKDESPRNTSVAGLEAQSSDKKNILKPQGVKSQGQNHLYMRNSIRRKRGERERDHHLLKTKGEEIDRGKKTDVILEAADGMTVETETDMKGSESGDEFERVNSNIRRVNVRTDNPGEVIYVYMKLKDLNYVPYNEARFCVRSP